MTMDLPTTNERRLRIGPGRALVFAAASTAAPITMHGAGAPLAIAAVVALTIAFAACSSMRRTVVRSPVMLIVALIVAQSFTHATLSVAGRDESPSITSGVVSASHSTHAMPMPSDGAPGAARGSAMPMLAAHLAALLAGFVTLLSLERRAARLLARYATSIVRLLSRRLGLARPAHDTPRRVAPELDAVARAVRALHTQRLASGRPHRGPPRLAH